MRYTVFDVESDGLLNDATTIHCLSYNIIEENVSVEKGTLVSYEAIGQFLLQQDILVGHNIIRYDIPLLEKFNFKLKPDARFVDTLGISWYLYPNRSKHGLDSYGEEFENLKVKIEDWKNLSEEMYVQRCERDVEINTELFLRQKYYLEHIYEGGNIFRIISYIGFKLNCLKDQEMEGITLDIDLAQRTKVKLEEVINNKVEILSKLMPAHLGKIIRSKPKVRTDSWDKFLRDNNYPPDITEVRELPNPLSHAQMKKWLDSLGWEPLTFKFSKSTNKRVPQISLPFGQGLCSSVKELYPQEPALIEFEGLSIAQHRLGLINGFLESVDDRPRVYSTAHGFTNTMRLEHSKPIVNLPGVGKPYGEEIRGCLITPDETYFMCGADISGLEDNTKQHYIYFFDPDYVTQMRVPGFDPHIDIALLGGMITEDDAEFFKAFEKQKDTDKNFSPSGDDKARHKRIKAVRQDAKVVNFSATYGAGPPKIAESLKKPLAQAKLLHSIYWKRNLAVKKTASACTVKEVFGQKWLYNPISRFWMFLKQEKDRFSTLNQSSGVFVFDSWLRNVIKRIKPIKVILQYHDELLLVCKDSDKDFVERCLHEAMEETNKEIKLNVQITISTSWGRNYAECH